MGLETEKKVIWCGSQFWYTHGTLWYTHTLVHWYTQCTLWYTGTWYTHKVMRKVLGLLIYVSDYCHWPCDHFCPYGIYFYKDKLLFWGLFWQNSWQTRNRVRRREKTLGKWLEWESNPSLLSVWWCVPYQMSNEAPHQIYTFNVLI